MSKASESTPEQYKYTQNRELSWLRFNQRVLEEAADETVPIMERLKFISIFSSNLDEFFMVRVGSIFDISVVAPKEIDDKSGMTPREQLDSIYRVIPALIEQKKHIYSSVCGELLKYGIEDVSFSDLTSNEQKFIDDYFNSRILPILSPQIVDSHHPTPHLQNKQLYITSLLKGKNSKKYIGFIPVPETLLPIVMLNSDGRFIRTENIILQRSSTLYGQYKSEEACVISVTRNADVSFDSEKFEDTETDFRAHVKKLLKKRSSLAIVRMEISRKISDNFFKELTKIINVENHQIYIDRTPLKMQYVFQLADVIPKELKEKLFYPRYTPEWPVGLNKNISIIKQIEEKDRMLFFPFDSVEPFIYLLNEAAERKDVISIKITIYRLASSSRIVRALCTAAERGKEVIVLMELRARFDEENNIAWSKMLEDAGCKVIYGIENFKCHSKICLITLKEKGKFKYITQIGTGNYNEKTNAMYTDISIMTASETIGADGNTFFRNMLISNIDGNYNELLAAPKDIKPCLCKLIDRETEKGSDGYICIKVNSVTERDIIDRLAKASKAGVEINMIVRGICCIRPKVSGETENISVTSIVGRFLEHARIYCFGKGKDATLFISSADLMTRNLKRRVEIAYPVYDSHIKEQLMNILSVQLSDTAKASYMLSDGSYVRKNIGESVSTDSQYEFMRSALSRKVPIKENRKSRLKQIWKRLKNKQKDG